MTLSALRMLFRKGETASAILVVALLVAIPASISPTVNHINSQTEALGGYVSARARIVKAQQLKEFMQGMNSQTLTFLNLWSIAVYAIVAANSYVVATRLTAESSYELATLRAFLESLRNSRALLKPATLFKKADDSITGQTDG